MENNIDTLFNFCLIIAFSLIAIWGIRAGLEFRKDLRASSKAGAKKKAQADLARKQVTLAAVAKEQKAHNNTN